VSVEAEHSQLLSITVFYGKVAPNRPGRGWIFSESVFGRWFYPWNGGSWLVERGTFAASFLAKIEGLCVRDVKARVGAIDGLVNNAGITRPAMIKKMTLQQWSEVISVHLTGAFLWTQAAAASCLLRGRPAAKVRDPS